MRDLHIACTNFSRGLILFSAHPHLLILLVLCEVLQRRREIGWSWTEGRRWRNSAEFPPSLSSSSFLPHLSFLVPVAVFQAPDTTGFDPHALQLEVVTPGKKEEMY